jgi:hypothetical protein
MKHDDAALVEMAKSRSARIWERLISIAEGRVEDCNPSTTLAAAQLVLAKAGFNKDYCEPPKPNGSLDAHAKLAKIIDDAIEQRNLNTLPCLHCNGEGRLPKPALPQLDSMKALGLTVEAQPKTKDQQACA